MITVFSALMLLVNPALSQRLIDDVIVAQNADPLLGILMVMLAVKVLREGLRYLMVVTLETDSQNVSKTLNYKDRFGFATDDISVEQEESRVTVRFNSSVAQIQDVLGYTLQRVNVSDISVKDADIEEIIRLLYKQGVEQ